MTDGTLLHVANEGRLGRLSITVLSVLTLAFCGVQLWGVTDAPAAVPATTGPAPPDEEANGVREQSAASITLAFAGDVNFSERTADRLAADPATAFGAAAEGLAAADLTVVNLETAIATGGQPEPKSFTFRAPPSALGALRAAGVDAASPPSQLIMWKVFF